ncbi:MAG: hypothetical protein HKM93_00260 [Desulfobacteraceae bacterium]|nr:hypothetical protein [Desulfobacteraceae bacterium]
MAMSPADVSAMIFKRLDRTDLGEFSIDSQMLSVLMELNGQQNLGKVAQKKGMSISEIRAIVSKLLKLRLIVPVEEMVKAVDKDFLNFLHGQLSQAVGPIAELLIEETISDLGHTMSNFPTNRAAELVELLAREIQRDEKAVAFKQNILQKIRAKGY